KSLGDAQGFMYWGKNDDGSVNGIMGDSVHQNNITSLHAVSPLPGRFRLIHNGRLVDESSDISYEYSRKEPFENGAYRIELHINFNNKLVPWLYTNPIYIHQDKHSIP